MPYCRFCKDFYCAQTHSSPAESCECGANTCAEDLREAYFASEREPSEDELEEQRSERRAS